MVKEKVEYVVKYVYGRRWNQNPKLKYRTMECRGCGQMTFCGDRAVAVLCSMCVRQQVEPPESVVRKKSNKPVGWHFRKEYVDPDGNVFHRGVEQPDLKGTLPPTPIVEKKPRIKRSRAQRQNIMNDALRRVSKLKKELEKARFKKDKKVIQREIKKYNRIASGKIPADYVV